MLFSSVKEDTLRDMVDAMTDKVGLVHQMPYTCDGVGLPSTLEKVTLPYFVPGILQRKSTRKCHEKRFWNI